MQPGVAYTGEFHRSLAAGASRSAEVIVPIVLRLIPAKRVVDIGCGLGHWLAVFARLGAADILGVDGDGVNPADLAIPPARFLRRDITQPLDVGRRFDLALSLEVAEHLPAEHADAFVASLARLAPAILFSAAIPHQGGFHHVNEQWPDYWVERFQRHELVAIDAVRPAVWQDDRVEWWYAQNTLLFADAELIARTPALQDALARTDPRRLAIVHPRNYARAWPG